MARTPTDPTKAQVWVTKGLDELDFEFYFPQGPKGDAGGFNNSTAIPAGSDLNNYVFAGTYHVAGVDATSIANNPRPTSAIAWSIVVWARSSTVVTQDLWLVNNATTLKYSRSLVSNVWGPWEVYPPVWVDQTAGRTISIYDYANSRKQQIYGDTGWRDLTPLSGTAAWVRLRRVGNMVSVWVADWANGTSADIVALPLGFQTGTNSIPSIWGIRSTVPTLLTIAGPGNMVQAAQSASSFSAFTSFPTVNSWPTSLPGVAHASIPNL